MQILTSCETSQASTNTLAIISTSILDATQALSVSFTLENTGDNSVDYSVLGGNTSDLSDGTTVQASATLTSGSFGTYAVSIAPYAYYGITIVSTVPDTHGELTIHGRAKG